MCAYPWMEIYEGETIHFMVPLSKQHEFFVPEADDSQEELGESERFAEESQS